MAHSETDFGARLAGALLVVLGAACTPARVTSDDLRTSPVRVGPVTLARFPVSLERIERIVPLGNLNPPGHVFPTDHIYIALRAAGPGGRLEPAAVVAPGPLRVVELMRFEHRRKGIRDYSLRARVDEHTCITLGHLDRLTPGLETRLEGAPESAAYLAGGEIHRCWRSSTDTQVRAGDLLGWIGGPDGNQTLDFGLYDDRHRPPALANPRRWAETPVLQAIDPLSRFPHGTLRQALQARVEIRGPDAGVDTGGAGERPTRPAFGLLQDRPGTAQGCWFDPGHPPTYPEDPHLALVHSNLDRDRLVFSVGTSMGTLASGAYLFVPQPGADRNRPFSEVRADGAIHTYALEGLPGLVLLAMRDAETLWIEYRPVLTAGTLAFSERHAVYVR